MEKTSERINDPIISYVDVSKPEKKKKKNKDLVELSCSYMQTDSR